MPRARELALALALGTPGAATAQVLPVGEWELGTRPTALAQEIDAAIDAVAGDMSMLLRPVAREILHRVAEPCAHLSIRSEGPTIAIQCDTQVPAVAVPGSGPTPYTGRDGRTHSVAIEHTESGLVQRFETSRGTRTNTYTLRDGSLHVAVRLESPRLPRPVQYAVEYR